MAIRLERTDAVATIVIDRPEARNAVNGPAARALADAFREFEADDTLRVAVLWGAGGVFCAGADLKARGTELGLRLSPEGDGPMGPSRMVFSKPTIAAVEGYAVAGGLELALMCDLRVASESAVFGVFCRRWGVPLIDGGTVRLPRLIGLSRALDMILTGRPVDAHEALAFGLANRVVRRGPRSRRGGVAGANHRRVSAPLCPERSPLSVGGPGASAPGRDGQRVHARQDHDRFGRESGGRSAFRRGRRTPRTVLTTRDA